MRILVTGGAGFIGSNLCRVLLAEGVEPVVVDDGSGGVDHPPDPRRLARQIAVVGALGVKVMARRQCHPEQDIERLVGEKLLPFFSIVPVSSRELTKEPDCIDYPYLFVQ